MSIIITISISQHELNNCETDKLIRSNYILSTLRHLIACFRSCLAKSLEHDGDVLQLRPTQIFRCAQ